MKLSKEFYQKMYFGGK